MNYEKFNSLSLSLLKNKLKQKKEKALILLLSVLISVLFVSTITYGATTIGSNINTGGTLTVSGNATLGDDATDLIKSIGSFYASSTLQATGAARFYSTARIDGATILNTVSYAWPSSDGSSSQYLQTNGAGTLSWATVSSGANSDWLKQTNFGVLNLTASTTIPYWAKDAIYASSTLQVQGLTTLTNASTTQTSVSSNFYTGLTANSVPFIGANGLLTQNTSNFIWDNTNTRLGIGTTTPNWLLQVAGTRPFLTLSDTGAAANNKHWFLSSQGGNFYLGTTTDAYATTSISALTITNGGNVGIATSSPQSALLSVENTGTGYTFYATDSANDTTPFVIDASGNVGVGTAAPDAMLEVSAPAGSNSQIYLSDLDVAHGITGQAPTDTYGVFMINSVTDGGLQIRGLSDTAGETPLTLKGIIGNSNPSDENPAILINGMRKNGTTIADLNSSETIFQIQNNDNAVSLALLGGGNLGIGTTTPNWLLQAAGTRPFLTLSDTGASANNKHWFLSSQGGNFYIGTSSDAYATSTSNLLNLISSNYSVGIGTTSPAEQLSISGRLFVGGTGTSTIENNLYVMGTLRSTVSYVGDLVFSNNFRFIETNQNEKIQSLFLQNQYGENIFKINEKGELIVREIESQKIKTKELQIGSPQNRTGITIYDEKTGKPFCLKISDGKISNKEGECK